MNISLQIKYRTDDDKWLCFTHATLRATQKEWITPIIDQYDSEYDCRDTTCADCKEVK